MHTDMVKTLKQQKKADKAAAVAAAAASAADTPEEDEISDLGLGGLEKYKASLDTMVGQFYERGRGPLQDAAVCNFVGGAVMDYFVGWGEKARYATATVCV
jgi:hypothetical protein